MATTKRSRTKAADRDFASTQAAVAAASTAGASSGSVVAGAAQREFDPTYVLEDVSTFSSSRVYAWDQASVADARAAHLVGDFGRSRALIRDVRKDAAIFAALRQLVAPLRGLPSRFYAPRSGAWADKGRGEPERVRAEAAQTFDPRSSGSLSTALLAEVVEELTLAGFCITRNVATVRDDGSRIDLRPEIWPLDSVVWSPFTGLHAVTTKGTTPIVHGDGRWTIFSEHETCPWAWGAVVPLSICWVDRAFGLRDRRKQSEVSVSGKPIVVLPKNTKVRSPEGQDAIKAAKTLHKPFAAATFPGDTEVKWVGSDVNAWQIYREIIKGNDSDIPKILLGQDGSMKGEGGNYVASGMMLGVRNDIVEGYIAAVVRGLHQGLFRPWSWLNFGDVELAPRMEWLMPDVDQDARAKSLEQRVRAFNADIQAFRANGYEVDQAFSDAHAERYGVVAPRLAADPT